MMVLHSIAEAFIEDDTMDEHDPIKEMAQLTTLQELIHYLCSADPSDTDGEYWTRG